MMGDPRREEGRATGEGGWERGFDRLDDIVCCINAVAHATQQLGPSKAWSASVSFAERVCEDFEFAVLRVKLAGVDGAFPFGRIEGDGAGRGA